MPSVLIVEKNGNIKSTSLKTVNDEELCKKAGFKTVDGFKSHTNWTIDLNGQTFSVHLYGKTDGRANQENKYEFPPPVDTVLFFGSCVLVNINAQTGEAEDLTKDDWEEIYDELYGGFEDIGDEESEEDLSDDDSEVSRTKSGYVKDGFVVDDKEEEEEEEDEEEEDEEEEDEEDYEEEEEEVVVKKTKKAVGRAKTLKPKKATTVKKATKTKAPKNTVFTNMTENATSYLDCSSELTEEEYMTGP